jgi:putative membrane protein
LLDISGAIPRAQLAMVGALFVALALAQIDQPYPAVAPLHHIPTLILLIASPFLLRRWPMSNGAVACVALFFALHTLGGRYTYSNVPYDEWANALWGKSISQALGLGRNDYDRLVHFAYGLLAVFPTREFLQRHLGISARLALYIAVESVIAVSAIYELFEWFLSIVLAGPMAADYNGQQGDIWDAQKDMALATIGALTAALILKLTASRPKRAADWPGRAAGG